MNPELPTTPDVWLPTVVIVLLSIIIYIIIYIIIGTICAALRCARGNITAFDRGEIISCWVCFWPFIGAWMLVSWPFRLLFHCVERRARRRIKP